VVVVVVVVAAVKGREAAVPDQPAEGHVVRRHRGVLAGCLQPDEGYLISLLADQSHEHGVENLDKIGTLVDPAYG
jgi:hypothetical protein